VWLGLAIVVSSLAVWIWVRGDEPLVGGQLDAWVLRTIASLRNDWLTPVMRGINILGSGWVGTILGWVTVVLLIVFKRWRHLFTFVGTLAVTSLVYTAMFYLVRRPRPYDVTILGDWAGWAMPSIPTGLLATCLLGMTYSLVVPGRPRQIAKWAVIVTIAALAFARLYLAVDHLRDIVWAIVPGVAIPLVAFRTFTPNEVFPVTYRRGRTAHLDITGPRAEAIRKGVAEQLGLTVLEIQPIGLAASGGSTPLRLRIAGDPDTYVFAKLYAKNHVRADRWYKLGRTILYGGLEDETSFQTVRRFVEYEDYTLRLMQDFHMPVPTPYGIVEITPEREYAIVMEYFAGAVEISEADVDDQVIDDGLLLVRRMWDSGIAHRDVKPGNVMVRDGRVLLVDAFFVQVRPSPWRQAVDLGNMMLVLALRSDPERVYQHAQRYFTPAEIAEAFAATRGVASPTQLRSQMKKDGRDLLEQFRRLAPHRRAIPIQRWNVRRIAVTLGILAVSVVAFWVTFNSLLQSSLNAVIRTAPQCAASNVTVLMAQAVPSATNVPCFGELPPGWTFTTADIHDGQARFWLHSDKAGQRAVTVTLTGSCADTTIETQQRNGSDSHIERFPGGCVTYDYTERLPRGSELRADIDSTLGLLERDRLITYVRLNDELTLCGAGTTCVD
jgi:tRNA A-37 threonylcarbamoyl transferase component Bud32